MVENFRAEADFDFSLFGVSLNPAKTKFMKRSNYLLKIEDSCSESWAAMSPTDSGRFCTACAKNVTDFTNLSDDNILAIIKKSSGNLCGRMEENQMNRFLVNKTEPSNKARFFRFVAGLFLLSAAEGKAQEMIMREPMAMVKPPTEQEKFEKEIIDSPHYKLKIWVKGQVISAETKEPVAKAHVTFGRINRLALTDEDGYFNFLLPDSLAEKRTFLRVAHHQAGQTSVTTTADEFPQVIELVPFDPADVISAGGLTVVKRKWWQRRKKYCK